MVILLPKFSFNFILNLTYFSRADRGGEGGEGRLGARLYFNFMLKWIVLGQGGGGGGYPSVGQTPEKIIKFNIKLKEDLVKE